MPSYDYKCDNCNHTQEHKQSIKEDKIKTCPMCMKETYQRLITGTNFNLKGSGWFKTDGKYKT